MRRAGAVLSVLLLAGCTSFGYQRSSVPIARDDLFFWYGDVREMVGIAKLVISQGCVPGGRITPAECDWAKARYAQLQAWDGTLRAKVREHPGGLTAEDVQKAITLLRPLLGLAGGPGAAAALGGLGERLGTP